MEGVLYMGLAIHVGLGLLCFLFVVFYRKHIADQARARRAREAEGRYLVKYGLSQHDSLVDDA